MGNYGEVIDYLQRHIRREMERQDVPGLALALVDDQQLVRARGFGYMPTDSTGSTPASTPHSTPATCPSY